MPSTRCPYCNGTVSTTRRGQTVDEALANHVRLAHEGDRLPTHPDADGDDDDERVFLTKNDMLAALGSAFRLPEEDQVYDDYRFGFRAEYEMMTRRPFFVYGTLRPGQGNDRLWRGDAVAFDDGECIVKGYRLVGRGSIPYAVRAEGKQVVGCLVDPFVDAYANVARALDGLEGYPVHYDRIVVDVYRPGRLEPMEAWMYSPPDERWLGDREEVPDGDWVADNRARRAERSRELAPVVRQPGAPVPARGDRPKIGDTRPAPTPVTTDDDREWTLCPVSVDVLTDDEMRQFADFGEKVVIDDGSVATLDHWPSNRRKGKARVTVATGGMRWVPARRITHIAFEVAS